MSAPKQDAQADQLSGMEAVRYARADLRQQPGGDVVFRKGEEARIIRRTGTGGCILEVESYDGRRGMWAASCWLAEAPDLIPDVGKMSRASPKGCDVELREAVAAGLSAANEHIQHMAAWITKTNASDKPLHGYSFEALGEDKWLIDRATALLSGNQPKSEPDGLTERLTKVAYATEFLDVRDDILTLIERDRRRWLDNIAMCELLARAREKLDAHPSGASDRPRR